MKKVNSDKKYFAHRKKRSSCLDVKKLIYSRRQNILKPRRMNKKSALDVKHLPTGGSGARRYSPQPSIREPRPATQHQNILTILWTPIKSDLKNSSWWRGEKQCTNINIFHEFAVSTFKTKHWKSLNWASFNEKSEAKYIYFDHQNSSLIGNN